MIYNSLISCSEQRNRIFQFWPNTNVPHITTRLAYSPNIRDVRHPNQLRNSFHRTTFNAYMPNGSVNCRSFGQKRTFFQKPQILMPNTFGRTFGTMFGPNLRPESSFVASLVTTLPLSLSPFPTHLLHSIQLLRAPEQLRNNFGASTCSLNTRGVQVRK